MTKHLLLGLALLFSILITAENIDEPKARLVAANYLNHTNGFKTDLNAATDLQLACTYTGNSSDKDNSSESNVLIYVFNLTGSKGFVLISGDDRVTPVLGYSNESAYSLVNIPPALQKMIENYKQQISYAQEQNLQPTSEIETEWHNLLENAPGAAKSLTTVGPLLSTTWDQAPYYNDLCPYNIFYFQHTVTGCVATAMAQIMKYWAYPSQGTGFHSYVCQLYGTQSANFAATTYNWASMPNNVTSTNDAVATLMYHCGVSVDMDYGLQSTGGSSAYVIYNNGQFPACAEIAYKTYFGYNPNTLQGLERANYTDEAWINLLKTDLNNSRPIQYAGFGPGGGHTFVCDGYDASNFFHMNWGWGGSFDGYFDLDALNPGSGGTGGGSYIYNDNQQAVIGIQPLSGGGSGSEIELYSSITITPDPIDFYQAFTVNADVINAGSSNFVGDYCAALFDSEGIFIDYVETLTAASNPLPPGYHYTGGITFSNDGLPTVPGTYMIGIYYRDPGGEWILAASTSYTNPVYTTINTPYNLLEQYSDVIATPSTFVKGQAASVNVNFYNNNTYTYYGQYQAALYDLEGNFVQSIGVYNETGGLPSGYTYAEPFITFNCASITAPPGTYMLAILEKETGSSYSYYVGGTYFTTPVNIIVVAPPLSPDAYEPNDTQTTAKSLNTNWSNNFAQCYTTGSNNHIGTDYDFYKVTLAAGYNYVITARAHDSYNSGNGNVYTNDVLWSYNSGNGWSATYDDIMPGNIQVNGAGVVYFQVSPYFSGQTGTYLMDIKIQRSIAIGIGEVSSNLLEISPNPANSYLNVSIGNIQHPDKWEILNSMGQVVLNGVCSSNNQKINVSGLSNGVYLYSVMINNKQYVKKFVHNK